MVGQGHNETVGSILNNLKELERDFRRLVEQFQKLDGSSRLSGEMMGGVDYAKKHLLGIQREISNLVGTVATSAPAVKENAGLVGPPIIVRCKNWEDFKLQAFRADNISFLCREDEKSFQADAVKGGKVFTYSGQFPTNAALLRSWLSKELDTEKSQVWEGILALG